MKMGLKFHKPFSPFILETEVPQKFIDIINNSGDLVLSDKQKTAHWDWSDNLVGKVSNEIQIPISKDKDKKYILDVLKNGCLEYLKYAIEDNRAYKWKEISKGETPTKENIKYSILQPTNQELYSSSGDPLPYFPIITGKDYQRGQIIRYFAKKRNEDPPQIREITKDAFSDLNSSRGQYNYALWTVTSVFWKISGPLRDSLNKNGVKTSGIIDTNRRLVENANKDFRGIRQYLSNLIQFAVKSELVLLENLYTGGNELTFKKDNSDYTGYYHIMGDKKIMDGATHEQSTGKVLLSADASFSNQLGGLIQTELGKIGAQDNVAPTNNSRTLQTQLQNNISETPVTRQPSGGGGGGY